MSDLTPQQQLEFEAAAFRPPGVTPARTRRRAEHRPDEPRGFCRNCLSNWYRDAANAAGVEMDKEASREIVYGMPYEAWRALNQTEATGEQKAAFEASKPKE